MNSMKSEREIVKSNERNTYNTKETTQKFIVSKAKNKMTWIY